MTIDQSIRIEETGKDTIIAFVDKKYSHSLRIKSNIKKNIQSYFRKIGKPNIFPIVTFSVAVYLLIRHFKLKLDTLIIDVEYLGHESTIKNIILTLYRIDKITEPDIYFSNIGKEDGAHILAINVHRKKIKSDFELKELEIIKFINYVVSHKK